MPSDIGLLCSHGLLWNSNPHIGGYPGKGGISAILQRRMGFARRQVGQRPDLGHTAWRYGLRRVAPCYVRPTLCGQRAADFFLLSCRIGGRCALTQIGPSPWLSHSARAGRLSPCSLMLPHNVC